MTRKIQIATLAILGVFNLQAQKAKKIVADEVVLIKADTVQVSFENKLRPALQYNSDVNVKDAKKHWKSFLNRDYKISAKGKEPLVSEDVTINSISDKRMNFYASFLENGTGSKINFYAAFGYDIYIDPTVYTTEFANMKKIAETFLYESLGTFYNKKTNEISKTISSLTLKNTNAANNSKKAADKIEGLNADIKSLNEVEESDSKVYLKARKKITKDNKKVISSKKDIEKNKNLISKNEQEIKLLKKDLEYYKGRKELLKK